MIHLVLLFIHLQVTYCMDGVTLDIFESLHQYSDDNNGAESNIYNDEESQLMKYLFKSRYQKDARPKKNKTSPALVTFGIAYVQLGKLNDKEQILTSNIWVRQTWKNEYLTWDPKQFNGLKAINVDPLRIWVPDITLYNNAVKGKYSGSLYNFKTKVQLFHDGTNKWYSPATINSGCDIEITWFPFDYQKCFLTFGSWAYHGFDVDLRPDLPTADLEFYDENNEFELIAAPSDRMVNTFPCCPQPYPLITYMIVIKRKPGFHFFHIIIPSLSMTFISLLTFIAPHLTGERIGLAIESFLSLSFLLVLVSERMPINSNFTPMISKFLLSCMFFISATVICNLISANLSGKTKVPFFVRFVIFQCIAPLIGFSELKMIYVTNRTDDSARRRSAHGTKPKSYKYSLEQQTIHNMKDLLRISDYKKQQETNREFWCCIAKTLDRVFLLSFYSALIISCTLVMMQGYNRDHFLKGR